MKRIGMMAVILVLLAHLTSALKCYAGDSKIIFLIGKVEPSPELTICTNLRPGEMSVTLRYEDDLSACYSPEKGAPLGALCYFEIYGFEKARQSVRLEISSPGYKKFSKNIPSLHFTKNVARLDFGTIQLQKSDLPTVEQVIHSRAADGSHRFEITLHNRLKRDFLIRELTVAARIPGDGA